MRHAPPGQAASAAEQRVRSADGTMIAFERAGQGPALVLVTGALTDRTVTRSGPRAPGGSGAASEFGPLHGLHWLTVNMSARAPVLIAVDDAHWADTHSLRFLLYLARRAGPGRHRRGHPAGRAGQGRAGGNRSMTPPRAPDRPRRADAQRAAGRGARGGGMHEQ